MRLNRHFLGGARGCCRLSVSLFVVGGGFLSLWEDHIHTSQTCFVLDTARRMALHKTLCYSTFWWCIRSILHDGITPNLGCKLDGHKKDKCFLSRWTIGFFTLWFGLQYRFVIWKQHQHRKTPGFEPQKQTRDSTTGDGGWMKNVVEGGCFPHCLKEVIF